MCGFRQQMEYKTWAATLWRMTVSSFILTTPEESSMLDQPPSSEYFSQLLQNNACKVTAVKFCLGVSTNIPNPKTF